MVGFLSAWSNWRERREILRNIRRQRADQSELDRFKARDLLEEALAAIELNDRRKGEAIWKKTVERYPAEVRALPHTLNVLLKLHRYEEAEQIMREGAKKRPGDAYFAKGLANVALEKGDFDSAIERCATLRKRFPGVPEGYVFGAHSLAKQHRLNEAEALAEIAMKRFPNEIRGFLEYGRLAVLREDWIEAIRRWKIVQEFFSDRTFGPHGQAHALIKLGRYDEADVVLTAARVRFPTESSFLKEFALCAQARGDFPEAMKRWKRRIERAPMEPYGYLEASKAFHEMGDYSEAEAMLRAAVERFPQEEGVMIALAKYLHDREDFSGEAEAWIALRQVFVDNDEAYTRGAEALRRIGCFERASILLQEHEKRFKQRSEP